MAMTKERYNELYRAARIINSQMKRPANEYDKALVREAWSIRAGSADYLFDIQQAMYARDNHEFTGWINLVRMDAFHSRKIDLEAQAWERAQA